MNISKLERTFESAIWAKINNKTKPQGALGKLEGIAAQLALIQNQGQTQLNSQIQLLKPTMVVFAADHGIAAQGVSIASSEVTEQMVHNFLAGGAAINCFCRSNGLELNIVDAGMINPIEGEDPKLINQRLGSGSDDFSQAPAMSLAQAQAGMAYGQQLLEQFVHQGSNILLLGEMGIGNTSAAAAIMAALTNQPVELCVGKGTGIDQTQYEHKCQLVKQALSRLEQDHSSPTVAHVLSEVGGFEIVQMVGFILAAAAAKVTLVVDGFIVGSAMLAAYRIDPNVIDYVIFAHVSKEIGHEVLLSEMGASPLLDLGLALGEGTGAALVYPLITAAASFYNEMATFDSAGVTV